jgi:hypothetical protein
VEEIVEENYSFLHEKKDKKETKHPFGKASIPASIHPFGKVLLPNRIAFLLKNRKQ